MPQALGPELPIVNVAQHHGATAALPEVVAQSSDRSLIKTEVQMIPSHLCRSGPGLRPSFDATTSLSEPDIDKTLVLNNLKEN